MIELQNIVDSQKFIRVVKALGAANTYSDLELGYIYHGLDDMGVDPQLFFNYDLNVIIRDISRHSQGLQPRANRGHLSGIGAKQF